MDYKLLVDVAVLTGETMLKSGAETYRVEDTISRILKLSELEKTEAFVTATGIIVTLDDRSIDAISLVRRVKERTTNLNHIYLANNISRKLCNREIELSEAYEELKVIEEKKLYPEPVIWLCTVATAVFFVLLLGGNGISCVITVLNGGFIVLCRAAVKRLSANDFIASMAASFFIAFVTMFFQDVLGTVIFQEIVITGSIMPLVPGVAITNAVRDTLQGDYMSGGARAIEAFVTAASIAVGIGAGLSAYACSLGGLFL